MYCLGNMSFAEKECREPSEVVPIFHIFVVGFHHQKGCTVEYVYPPFSSSSKDSSLTNQLPPEWRHLPHLALPDGSHNYEEDSSFFVLPSTSHEGAQAIYGVACCRQIDSKEVRADSEVTRSTVQKSVCVLSKHPFYGSIEAKLKQVTQAYFELKDFSEISIIQDAFVSLSSSFHHPSILSLDTLQLGLSQQSQMLKLSHRLLQIFKALLLRKRVLVCGMPTNEVCKAILGILSLFPKSQESFAKYRNEEDEYGFPLQVFTSPFNIQPYLCLQQMDVLTDSKCTYLLVGVANPLFQKQHSKLCDVYMDMEDGLIDISDPKLRAILYLTSADLRFCDYICRSVQEVITSTSVSSLEPSSVKTTGWFGSNEWIRSQFRLYLLSLLSTSISSRSEGVREFGVDFSENWLKSSVFINWKLSSKKYTGISKVEPVHLCQGNLTFGDLKLRLSAQASEYGMSDKSKEKVGLVLLQTQQAVSNVRGAVGSAWNAASSAVSSWWYGDDEY